MTILCKYIQKNFFLKALEAWINKQGFLEIWCPLNSHNSFLSTLSFQNILHESEVDSDSSKGSFHTHFWICNSFMQCIWPISVQNTHTYLKLAFVFCTASVFYILQESRELSPYKRIKTIWVCLFVHLTDISDTVAVRKLIRDVLYKNIPKDGTEWITTLKHRSSFL